MALTYFARIIGQWGHGDVSSEAIDPDGHVAGWWVSSNPAWAKIDLPKSLPEGSELIWVEPNDSRIPPPCSGCNKCREAI